jgi:tetratricopeptide (TPR) repeat protein
LRLGGALWWFWLVRGYWTEGREHLAGLLALPGAEARTAARANALGDAGILARYQGDYAAARALHEERLAICRELEDKEGIAWSLGSLGWAARDQGDHGAARAFFEESLAIFRGLGNKDGIALSLMGLGEAARLRGDCEAARALLEECLAIYRELGDKGFLARSLARLGNVAHAQGDYGTARALFEESLTIKRELGDKRAIVQDLEGLAALAVAQAQPAHAARLFGAVEGLREAFGAPLPPGDRAEHDRCVPAVRTTLGEAAFAAAWAEGRSMSLEQSIDCALQSVPAP